MIIVILVIIMNVQRKRLFVGNLPAGVSEQDIISEFSTYGSVISVELKEKKDNVNHDAKNIFAFVNLEIDGWGLNKCVKEFSEQEWRGKLLKVAPAKESFMEKLQRERQEEQFKKSGTIAVPKHEDYKQIAVTLPVNTCSMIKHRKNKFDSSSSESADTSADHDNKKSEKNPEKKDQAAQQLESCRDVAENKDESDLPSDFVIKSNKHKSFENGKILRIQSGLPGCNVLKSEKPVNKPVDPQALEAEKKRVQSLNEKKAQYNQQKNQVQLALSKIDTNAKNKIIFKHEVLSSTKGKQNKFKQQQTENWDTALSVPGLPPGGKRSKLSLFDNGDEDDEGNYNFAIKEQFQGVKGQKLLELQSRFRSDKRFNLDSRFVEDEVSQEQLNESSLEENKNENDQDERRRQFDILEGVLGKKLNYDRQNADSNSGPKKSMLRFDPSKPDHEKFLTQAHKPKEAGKKKKKNNLVQLENQQEDAPVPEVSKDKFYKVTDNLKESLQEKSGFSLLSMFGKANHDGDDEGEKDHYKSIDISGTTGKNAMDIQNNPFRYDSSDSEEDVMPPGAAKSVVAKTETGGTSSMGVWRENFFFQKEDQRIKDAVTFFTSRDSKEDTEKDSFSKVRRELKLIVRNKVRNNLRNARPFKNKLGGRKLNPKFRKR